ncbi:MAG TPA: WD40 repeat domain-containing protein [Spirochaetota bacterium]|nr:WD40 repeat domain-containing protein [Spirochaetota bacterium]
MKALIIKALIIAAILFLLPQAAIFSADIYDLCYRAEPLSYGRLLFLRYKNPLLDPVLRSYELFLFDPVAGTLSSLQKYSEKLYILPAVSRDGTTVSYHSLIEGSDFLTTKNIEIGKSIRLRFDTGGYFVSIGIDYDNDRVAASVKRGENRQGIYLISSRASTISRIYNGKDFEEVGFLYNGNVYYIDNVEGERVLGIVYTGTQEHYTAAHGVGYVQKAPNGNAIIYSKGKQLYLFRAQGRESIRISENFDRRRTLPVFSPDGSTFAVFEERTVYIVNIPSGDIFYYLSIDTEGTRSLLTNYTYYAAKDNKLFALKHKQPGQSLTEILEDKSGFELLAVSPNDRYIVYRNRNQKEITVYDTKQKKYYRKLFGFSVEKVLYTMPDENIYIIARTTDPAVGAPIRELYLYNFLKESISPISTAANVDVKPYLRRE